MVTKNLFSSVLLSFIILSTPAYSSNAIHANDQLNNSATANNLIQNGSFELDSDNDGVPDFWHISSPGTRDCTEAYLGACSLMFPGYTLVKAKQKLNVSGTNGDKYHFTFWFKSTGGRTYHRFSWRGTVKCTDGTTHKSNWTFKTNKELDWFGPFGIPLTAQCDYTSIIIWFWYQGRGDSIGWFDDVSLQLESDSN